MSATAIKLICPECRHENEAERIYCHDCGARLDRSALSARKLPKAEAPEQTHKRLRSMFSQRRAKIRYWFFRVSKIILAAGLVAAVVQILLAPEVPPAPKKPMLSAQINMELETMTMYRRPPTLRYSEQEVNAFIASTLKNKKQQLDHPMLMFERAFLAFTPGKCRVVIERLIFGYSLFSTADYAVEVSANKLIVTSKAGWIGRLPVHPALMERATFLSSDVLAAMDRERRLLNRVGAIEFRDKEVEFAAPQ